MRYLKYRIFENGKTRHWNFDFLGPKFKRIGFVIPNIRVFRKSGDFILGDKGFLRFWRFGLFENFSPLGIFNRREQDFFVGWGIPTEDQLYLN